MKRIIPILAIVILAFSCNNTNDNKLSKEELKSKMATIDSLEKLIKEKIKMKPKSQISTFFTFQEHNAEEAMNFYISLFENSKVTSIQKYGKDGPAKEGTIMYATFELNGSQFACSDSPIKHEWDFTPGVSVFVECKSDAEIEKLATQLGENGKIFMPMGNYGFSTKFTFIQDRFGVSWQLNLP
ncbi:VOC family protein [uncultured Kordia sp.]|uniref:VOC family protein n=1 Tax=uncultured Kordia sp. TaxID=507699 RepID=UPI0026202561|nr:VOC family protein [uncultured Kordia sp.]